MVEAEVVDLYELGVAGAFPTCDGKVGRFVCCRDAPDKEGDA
jgi:hypothetical protein